MKYLLLLVSQVVVLVTSAQKIKISGVICGADLKPLPYVSIVERKDGNGTIASNDGRFSLVVKKGVILTISCVGYTTFSYSATKSSNIKVQLNNNPFTGRMMDRGVFFSNQEKKEGKLMQQVFNDTLIKEDKNVEEVTIFQRVEINPGLGGKLDSILLSDIRYDEVNGLKEIYLSFTISKNKKVENIKVVKGYSDVVDQKLIQNLSRTSYVFPAEQNGRRISIFCKLKFILGPDRKEKKLRIRNVD